MRLSVLIFVLVLPFAAAADNRVPLSKDPVLEAGLRIVAQAHFMRNNCNKLIPRYFRAFGLMNSLKARGRALGYSDAEMQAYLDNKAQKARVEGLAKKELEAEGVKWNDPASFCKVARIEIAADRGFGHYFFIR